MFLLDKFPKIRASELLTSQKFELTIRVAREPKIELQLASLIESSSILAFFSRAELELNFSRLVELELELEPTYF